MSAHDQPAQLWDITQVAERLGVTVRHVRRLIAERRVPFIKWGHFLRFDPAEIETWIASHHVAAGEPRRSNHSVRGHR